MAKFDVEYPPADTSGRPLYFDFSTKKNARQQEVRLTRVPILQWSEWTMPVEVRRAVVVGEQMLVSRKNLQNRNDAVAVV